MNSRIQHLLLKRLFMPFCLFICTLILYFPASAQEKPPRPITVKVSTAQNLNFGTIIPTTNNGGYVILDYTGHTTTGGDILILHPDLCSAALFIVYGEPGVLINIVYTDPYPDLNNGGFSLQLELGTPNIDLQSGFQFIIKSNPTYVYIGGKLDISPLVTNHPGEYSGSFLVTFNQE
jgi:hypothetical protein